MECGQLAVESGQVFVTTVGDPCAELRHWFTISLMVNAGLVLLVIVLAVIVILLWRKNR